MSTKYSDPATALWPGTYSKPDEEASLVHSLLESGSEELKSLYGSGSSLAAPFLADLQQNNSGIMNPTASLLPNRPGEYHDNTLLHDYRLEGRPGFGRTFRKPDSMEVVGVVAPDTTPGAIGGGLTIENYRDSVMDRTKAVRGTKPNMNDLRPEGGVYQPWEWRQFNGPLDMPRDSYYQPDPSRRTKMLGIDITDAQLRPNAMLVDGRKVVEETPLALHATPRNADMFDFVQYGSMIPRGMQSTSLDAPPVHVDPRELRQPITFDKSHPSRWGNPSMQHPLYEHHRLDHALTQAWSHATDIRNMEDPR